MSEPSDAPTPKSPAADAHGDFALDEAQTARLAALGFMVAGVCHEVANPLTAVHSMVQLLQSRPLPPETLERGLANIAANVQRVLAITRKLNDFSRVSTESRETISIDDPIAEALRTVREDPLFRAIDIKHVPEPRLVITCARDQLAQVYANILMNAAQAMDGRGRIVIESKAMHDSSAEVMIRDSGPGIAPGHLARLFEPFFTTKPAGQGTGLGLSISNEIVIEHGGAMRAENHPQGGACFRVILPLAAHKREAA
jgi:signal transduction histidine kinase